MHQHYQLHNSRAMPIAIPIAQNGRQRRHFYFSVVLCSILYFVCLLCFACCANCQVHKCANVNTSFCAYYVLLMCVCVRVCACPKSFCTLQSRVSLESSARGFPISSDLEIYQIYALCMLTFKKLDILT